MRERGRWRRAIGTPAECECRGKRRGARRWTNVVNASPEVKNIEWHYLLLAERDVNDAQGSWEQMKGFGR